MESAAARIERANRPSVKAIDTHFILIANVRKPRYHRNIRPWSAACACAGGLRMATPSNGAKITATNHETTSAMATTAKSVKVYSPAELAAKPTGTNPAIAELRARLYCSAHRKNRRDARSGKASQVVELPAFPAACVFQAFGDLLQRLLNRRTRPRGLDDHCLDDKGRILSASKIKIGKDAREDIHKP